MKESEIKAQPLQTVIEDFLADLENEKPMEVKRRLQLYCRQTIGRPPAASPQQGANVNAMVSLWADVYKWMVEDLFKFESIVWKEE